MTSSAFIDMAQTKQIFGTHTRHVEVTLRRLPDARLIWLNRRVMHLDPQFKNTLNTQLYKQHLLRQCAYAIPDEIFTISHVQESTSATVDRYGGEGIGCNGGSGRAVFVNGYHVKGIGRTPLVSPLTDQAHASGGAYLEECAREVVLSEIVDAEFPHGAVPVLAIIDTGFVQIWDTNRGPKLERRCLLIRPAYLRPAHFMRALNYVGHHHHDGMLDAQRVALTIQIACEQFGLNEFSAQWENFWSRWANQLAYAFVHRLNHGGNSASNIALDGQLMDFGGMTALPSWARISITEGGWPAGQDMNYLIHAQLSASTMLAKHIKQDWIQAEKWQSLQASALSSYQKTVVSELLRVSGLTRQHVIHLLNSNYSDQVFAASNRLLGHYSREQFVIFDGMPKPNFSWDQACFWQIEPPQHLLELRSLIELALSKGLFLTQTKILKNMWAVRCHQLSKTRSGLFRENIKEDLYQALDGDFSGKALTEKHVTQVINEFILRNRLDSQFEPDNSVPLGYAMSSCASYALFKDLLEGHIFALQEWTDEGIENRIESRITTQEIHSRRIHLARSDLSDIAFDFRWDEEALNIHLQ